MLRALVLTAVLAASFPAVAPARTAFTVSSPSWGATVTRAEVDHWARIARAADAGLSWAEARRQGFRVLTSAAWIYGEAAERGIRLPARVVTRELRTQRRQSFPRLRVFRRFLRATGQRVADIRHRIRVDLLSDRIRAQVVAPAAATVTEEDVDAYIAEHGTPMRPELRDLRVVVTRERAAARAARRALLRGASWRRVARRYSIDEASASDGGRLPRQAKGTLERRLDRAVFRAPVGRVRGPIRTRFGYYVFEVTRIRPPRPEPHWRRTVRRFLVARAQQAALDRFVTEFRTRWRARTTCAPGFRRYPKCGNQRSESPRRAPER